MNTLRKMGMGLVMTTLFMSLTAGGCSGDDDKDESLVGNEIIKGVWTTTQKNDDTGTTIYTTYHFLDGNNLYATRRTEIDEGKETKSSDRYLKGSWTLNEKNGYLTLAISHEKIEVNGKWTATDKKPVSTYITLSLKELKTQSDGLTYTKLDSNPIIGKWSAHTKNFIEANEVTGRPALFEDIAAIIHFTKSETYEMTTTYNYYETGVEDGEQTSRKANGTYELTHNADNGYTIRMEESYWEWDNGDRYDGDSDELEDEEAFIDMYDDMFVFHPEVDDDKDDDDAITHEVVFYKN